MTNEDSQHTGHPPAPPGLHEELMASAQQPGEKAALTVLTVHGRWLGHPGFLLACVQSFRGQQWIVWRMVKPFLARTSCSELDAEVLRMAAELALAGSGRRLDDSVILRQADERTRERLAEAIGPEMRAVVLADQQDADATATPLELAEQVLRWARQVPGMTTPARLLVVTPWLMDRTFVEQCLVQAEGEGGRTVMEVDWPAVAAFLAAGPEGEADAVGALRAALGMADRVRFG